jgi:hypothetical protein
MLKGNEYSKNLHTEDNRKKKIQDAVFYFHQDLQHAIKNVFLGVMCVSMS